MQYGVCNLGIIALRLEPSDKSEQVSQLLYGDSFKVLESRKSWYKIRLCFDNYEGWVDQKQITIILKEQYETLKTESEVLSGDLVECVEDETQQLHTIPLGSNLNALNILNHTYQGRKIHAESSKNMLIKMAFLYLNTPYLWGGKTPFGIDCSGFTQMVYKLSGYSLLRDASQQAKQGEALSFIEESEPGDLAFFDNDEGQITHVGIIMEDNYIMHAHGKVRIDRLDHSGIYNVESRRYTHKLRVIKKIF